MILTIKIDTTTRAADAATVMEVNVQREGVEDLETKIVGDNLSFVEYFDIMIDKVKSDYISAIGETDGETVAVEDSIPPVQDVGVCAEASG